jgi:hypothetical protein
VINNLPAWLDNPIIVKHARSKLRLQPLIAAVVIVLILCVCLLWAATVMDWFFDNRAFRILFALQVVILAIAGAANISQSVGSARASGILDFHRVSPISPTALVLGFFFGAPILGYLLFAITLPFSILCVARGSMSVSFALQLMVELLVAAWVLHSCALASALLIKQAKAAAQSSTGLLVVTAIIGGNIFFGVAMSPGFSDEPETLSFFGKDLPWLVVLMIYQVPALVFLFLASRRKMASDRAHVLSKLEAVCCLAVVMVLLLGGFWGTITSVPVANAREILDTSLFGLAILYILSAAACILAATITPSAGEYAKGLRRAEKLGRSRVGYWNDFALNRVALTALCAIVLIGPSIVAAKLRPEAVPPGRTDVNLSLPIATGVLVVAYVGLAMQYFALAFPRRGSLYFGLFFFLTWVIPIVLGSIVIGAWGGEPSKSVIGQVLIAMSPVTGIGLSAGLGNTIALFPVRAGVFCPALVFMFLFNNLVSAARRKIEKEVHAPLERPDSSKGIHDDGRAVVSVPTGV